MRTLNIAILGCGTVARFHAKALENVDNACLIGASSKSYSSVEAFCQEFDYVKPYKSYDELLDDPLVHAVSICTPSGEHVSQAIKAIEKGKAVIVEKPLCLSTEDADLLIKLAKEKGVCLATISQSRFSDAAQAIKKAIDSKELGKLVSASLMMRYSRTQAYYDSASWRGTLDMDGGGILMNQGIHGIDLLCYFMGRPVSVMGYARTILRNIEVEDTAVASLEFDNGALGCIDATVCSNPSFAKRFIIGGEKGTIILEDDTIKLWTLDTPCPIKSSGVEGNSSSDPKGITTLYHQREYENIANHILNNEDLLIDGNEGRIPLSVILGVYKSSESGKRVQL